MKRLFAMTVILALSAVLIWQRGTQAEAQAALRQQVSHCASDTLPPEQRLQVCTALLRTPDLSERAQASFHYFAGWALTDLEQYERAIDAFDQALSLERTRPYLAKRSYAHLMARDYEAGLADAYAVTRDWPDLVDRRHKTAASNIAWAYRKLDRRTDELAALDQYLTLWPDDAKHLKRRIHLVRSMTTELDRTDAALRELRDLSHLFAVTGQKNWRHLEARTELLGKMGLSEVALMDGVRAFETLLEHGDPAEEMSEEQRASLMEILAGARAGLLDAQTHLATQLDPSASDWDGLRAQAMVQFRRGRIDAALSDMDRMLALRPGDVATLTDLAYTRQVRDVLAEAGLLLE